jgi:hypothetical protein
MNRLQMASSAAAVILWAAISHAALPFAEDFDSGANNWKYNNTTDLTVVAAGGAVDDAGFVSRTVTFSTVTSSVLFRAQAPYGSSSGAYIGDWAAQGVGQVSAYVRHSAPDPLTFVTRLAGGDFNYPGATYDTLTTVAPGVWTPIVFDVTLASA